MWDGHRDMRIVAGGWRVGTGGTRKRTSGGQVGVTRTSGCPNGQIAQRLSNSGDLRGPWVADRLTDISREIDDELPVNDKVVIRLLQVQSEHFCQQT